MRIHAVGDSFCPVSVLREAFTSLEARHSITYSQVVGGDTWTPSSSSERSLAEYVGQPEQLIADLNDPEILVVHGAPVTDEVLRTAPNLRMLCVARGGPVNVDLAAASLRNVPVVTTPGKNAQAVAELTLTFMISLARRLPQALRHVDRGEGYGLDNFEGAEFFGRELTGATLGLVGLGRVGGLVAKYARRLDMAVLAYDPHLAPSRARRSASRLVELGYLLEASDFVSLHARATPDNRHMVGRDQFKQMKRGALFINTARDSLVDEDALVAALRSGHLGGAALDVASPSPVGERHRLLELDNVLLTPHIGGATDETLLRGAAMVAAEIERLERGEPLLHVVNRDSLPSRARAR